MFIAETDFFLSVPRFAREFGQLLRAVEKAASSRGIGVAEGRVLVALNGAGKSPSELSRELQLDSGQLARLTASLEAKRLVGRKSQTGGARARLALTPEGSRRAFELVARQRSEAIRVFGSLDEHQRERFLSSLRHLLEHLYSSDAEPLVRDAAPGESGLLVLRAVESFCGGPFPYDRSLEPWLSRALSDVLDSPNLLLVAERQRGLSGGIAIKIDPVAEVGGIRFFAVFKYEQGQGIGARLLHQGTERARSLGLRRLTAELPASDYGESFLSKFSEWSREGRQKEVLFGRSVVLERWSRALKR